MRKNSIKNTRLNEEVMRELSTIIRNEIKDPRIHPLTTVSVKYTLVFLVTKRKKKIRLQD